MMDRWFLFVCAQRLSTTSHSPSEWPARPSWRWVRLRPGSEGSIGAASRTARTNVSVRWRAGAGAQETKTTRGQNTEKRRSVGRAGRPAAADRPRRIAWAPPPPSDLLPPRSAGRGAGGRGGPRPGGEGRRRGCGTRRGQRPARRARPRSLSPSGPDDARQEGGRPRPVTRCRAGRGARRRRNISRRRESRAQLRAVPSRTRPGCGAWCSPPSSSTAPLFRARSPAGGETWTPRPTWTSWVAGGHGEPGGARAGPDGVFSVT